LKTFENVHLKWTFSDFYIVHTPLGGGGRQHRRLPRAANALAPPLVSYFAVSGVLGVRLRLGLGLGVSIRVR